MKIKSTFLCLLLFTLILSSCDNEAFEANGTIINEERELTGYTSISLNVPAKVYVSNDVEESFRIRTHENLLAIIDTDVIGTTLRISTSYNIRKVETLEIYVSANTYEKLSIIGSGTIITESCIQVDQLALEITGAGLINVCGSANVLSTRISGAGKIEAYGLEASRTSVDISGSGEVQTDVSESLDVNITGSGLVKYKGNPKISSKISGSGSIRKG